MLAAKALENCRRLQALVTGTVVIAQEMPDFRDCSIFFSVFFSRFVCTYYFTRSLHYKKNVFADVQLSSRCSLIVCPRTLVDHWCNEWRRFFPGRTPARHVEGAPTKWKSAEIVVAAYEELKGNSSLGLVCPHLYFSRLDHVAF